MDIRQFLKILVNGNIVDEINAHEKAVFEFIPELGEAKGFDLQDTHYNRDLYNCIMLLLKASKPTLEDRLAALFAILGKCKCKSLDAYGDAHYFDYPHQSRDIFYQFAFQAFFPIETRTKVSNLILYHDVNFQKMTEVELRTVIRQFDEDTLNSLFDLRKNIILIQKEQYHHLTTQCDMERNKVMELYKQMK